MLFPLTAMLKKFYRFIIFSFLVNVVILLLNCLGLILYLYILFLSLKDYMDIIWAFILLRLFALKVS